MQNICPKLRIMDTASDELFNILRVKPVEDLEDIHDGICGAVCT